LRGARATAARIRPGINLVYAACEIAKHELEQGRRISALASLRQASSALAGIENASFTAYRYVTIGGLAAQAGAVAESRESFSQAIDVMRKRTFKNPKSQASHENRTRSLIERIARIQASRGDLAGAKQTAMLVKDRSRRDALWTYLHAKEAETGRFRAALAHVATLSDAPARAWLRKAVAVAQAKSGAVRDALLTVGKLEERLDRALAYQSVAAEQARQGKLGEAAGWIAGLKDPFARARACMGVADTLLDAIEKAGK
jgi:hypothetical protein